MSGFSDALAFILPIEGGFVDSPIDRGGKTNKGVRQDKFDAWLLKHNRDSYNVRAISDEDLSAFYHEQYWVAADCDGWYWPLSLAMFDAAVQHGPKRAIMLLQKTIQTTQDGISGPKTRGAVSILPPKKLLNDLVWNRIDYYARIVRNSHDQAGNIVGWMWRMRTLNDRLKEDVAY